MASSTISCNVALAGVCMVARPFAMHDDAKSMAGIDIMSLAHNQSMDYGKQAMAATIKRLSRNFGTETDVDNGIGIIRF